jgi:hypothetical protein
MRSTLVTLLFLVPVMANAQTAAREFTADLRPFSATLSLAWRAAPATYLGIGLGGGIDMFDRTLSPDPDGRDLEQLLHVDAFVRQKPSAKLDLDLGARWGLGGVGRCNGDCGPGFYSGIYASAMWGGRHFKLGPRLFWVRVREFDGGNTGVLHLAILTGRWSVGW